MDQVEKNTEEWLRQAAYDLDTAEAMMISRKYIYTVFMCHLAVEKTLKALWNQKYLKTPGKTHDLVYLSESLDLEWPQEFMDFLDELNDLSVPTRYPDELEKALKQFTLVKTEGILRRTKRLIAWLKK